MTDTLNNISLTELKLVIGANPRLNNFVKRQFLISYDDFINTLYEDIDFAIRLLETNPQHYQKDDEDKLTEFIVSTLNTMGYDATHGTTGGGNRDILVKENKKTWSWIGEAKIYRSINDLWEGFLQLSTRYRNLDSSNAKGGLLAYVFQKYAADKMEAWRAEISQKALDDFSYRPCTQKAGLAFFSVHKHEATGLPFEVRHVGVALHFLPQDKSGRTAKKYKNSRSAEA